MKTHNDDESTAPAAVESQLVLLPPHSAPPPADVNVHAIADDNDSDYTLHPDKPFDFAKFTRRMMKKSAISHVSASNKLIISRCDESDIKRREIGVMFKDLKVVGLGATARHQPTFSSTFNPVDILRSVLGLRHPALRDILDGFEGVVRPGEMLR